MKRFFANSGQLRYSIKLWKTYNPPFKARDWRYFFTWGVANMNKYSIPIPFAYFSKGSTVFDKYIS